MAKDRNFSFRTSDEFISMLESIKDSSGKSYTLIIEEAIRQYSAGVKVEQNDHQTISTIREQQRSILEELSVLKKQDVAIDSELKVIRTICAEILKNQQEKAPD